MPSGPRIRTNNVFGTLTDNPLLVGATTMNGAGLANLAAVSSAHALIILDPLRTAGAPEMVVATAHTAAATSATITRGAYGTTARQHAAGVLWVHAASIEDAIQILTSSTRPSDPYQGQMIFETDTNSFVARDTSDAWQTAMPMGTWTSWTPTLTNLTLGSGTSVAAYARVGRMIHWRWAFTLGAGSAVGTDPSFTLPVAPAASHAGDYIMGRALLGDVGSNIFDGILTFVSASTCRVYAVNTAGTYASRSSITATVPHTWASPDFISVVGFYEAVS